MLHIRNIALLASLLPPAILAQTGATVDFRRDVQPIFKEHCYGCHGPNVQRNGFRLDRRRDAMLGGTLAQIGPGNAAASRLYLRLTGATSGIQMPPTGALSAPQIEIIKNWIDQGAQWPDDLSGETPPPPPDPAATRLMTFLRNGDGGAFRKALAEDPKAANRKGPAGSTPLMYAVLYADAATVRLLLTSGADPNVRNDAGATALMWAARDPEKAALLVDRGADVNARSNGGRTPLLIAAGWGGPPVVVKLLLDHGADPNVNSPGLFADMTPLAEAAGSANEAALRMLIDHGANVKAAGVMPLFLSAVTHCAQCLDIFLKPAGPDLLNPAMVVLAPPLDGALTSHVMLEHGADANARDPLGSPILTLVASAETMPVDFVKELLSRGADVNARNPLGETALEVARRHGHTAVVDALLQAGAKDSATSPATAPKPKPAPNVRTAFTRSMTLLQHTDNTFLQKSGCVSCHNNTLTALTRAAARQNGLPVDEAAARRQAQTISLYLDGWRERVLQRVGIPGDTDTIGAILAALAAENFPPDANTDAMAIFIKGEQLPNGQWPVFAHRPPLESSPIASTVMAIRALQAYAPGPLKPEYDKSVQLAASWLAQAPAQTTADRAMQLLGLAWTHGDSGAIRKTAGQLLAGQQPDGGWRQLPTLSSDAFATGQALVGLRESGAVSVTAPAYQRGVQFLMKSQADDGSWFVARRAMPIQPYFESGFPYGHDQWISAAATNWAAMALAPAAH